MSHPTPNPFRPPSAWLFQGCGGVLPGEPTRASTSLAQLAAAPTLAAPHPTVRLSPAQFAWHLVPLSTLPNGFNTHRDLAGPRFSTTDF